LDEKRSDYFPNVFEGNIWIEARQKQAQDKFDRGFFTRQLADNFGNGLSNFFPLLLHADGSSLLERAGTRPNLSEAAAAYLERLGAEPEDLFYHALAVLHAPAYRSENAGALRQDWPRLPLPPAGESLQASAALGRRVAALLDSETPVPGVTCGTIRDELKGIAVFRRLDGKPARPEAGDLDLTAGWGHAGKGGVTMPGRGRIEKTLNAEHSTLNAHLSVERSAFSVERSLDIYLNDAACWRNVPEAVWDYTIGGYQVIKKWLSYREKPLLGRGLTPGEVRHVTDTARRLAALIGMQRELDGSYRAMAMAE
ncbi:MAG: type ISP restriction/modification enzyme, partial [FCB group bacterium]|nr:type ISP restriction/modification enzyme [FCB group bacterium]